MNSRANFHRHRLQSKIRVPAILFESQASLDQSIASIEKSALKVHLKKTLKPILKRASALFNQLPENEQALTGYIDMTLNEISQYFGALGIRGGDPRMLRRKFNDLREAGHLVVKKQLNVIDGVSIGGNTAFLYVLEPSLANPEFTSPESRFVENRSSGATGRRRISDKKLAQILKERDSESYALKYDDSQASKTEAIYCGLTDTVQRTDSRYHKDVKHQRGERKIENVRILITSQTSAHPDAELMAWNDQRVVRAFITHLTYAIDEVVDDLVADILGHPRNPRFIESAQQDSLFDDDNVEDAEYEEVLTAARQEVSEMKPNEINGSYISVSAQKRKAAEAKARKMVRNDFILDVGDIALRLGAKPEERHSGGLKRMINWAFRRIHDTTFHISLEGKNSERWRVARKLGLMRPDENGRMNDWSVKEVGLIAGMKSQYEEGFDSPFEKGNGDEWVDASNPYRDEVLERTRIWRIQVDLEMFDSLLDPEQRILHRSHSKIMADPSPLSQALYNFFSGIIGKTNRMAILEGRGENATPKHKEDSYYFQPLEHLRQRVCPTRDMNELLKGLTKIMKKSDNRPEGSEWDESLEKNSAKLWGHDFILFDRNAPENTGKKRVPHDFWLYVKRDTDDPEIGNNSKFNLGLAKKFTETTGLPVPKSRLPGIDIVKRDDFLELILERFG